MFEIHWLHILFGHFDVVGSNGNRYRVHLLSTAANIEPLQRVPVYGIHRYTRHTKVPVRQFLPWDSFDYIQYKYKTVVVEERVVKYYADAFTRLCAHTGRHHRKAAVFANQKRWLELDEDEFLSTAIYFPVWYRAIYP